MSNMLRRLGDVLRSVLGHAVAALLGVIMILVFVQVLARYITHSSTFELAELCRILLIWLVFIGAAVLVSQRKLIVIDLMHGRLSGRLSNSLGIGVDILTAILLVAFAIYAAQLIDVVKLKIAPATGLSYRWFYMPPIVFSVCGLFFIVERLVCGATDDATEVEDSVAYAHKGL